MALPRPAILLRWAIGGAVAVAVVAVALEYRSPTPIAPPADVPRLSIGSASAPDAPAVVWAVGDGADGSGQAKRLARRITRDRPDRFLYLGDVYDEGSPDDFRENYATVYRRLDSITAPTPGNHEWPARDEGYDRYFTRTDGARPPRWYSFRIGGWRAISLNSEASHDAGSDQVRWLERTLRAPPHGCTLAFFHRPLQSASSHGDQRDMRPIWNVLRGHAQLVINAHDHNLQRFRPRDGMTQLVIGAGGEELYPIERDRRLRFGDDRRQGALRMTLRPGAASLSIVGSNGRVLDRSFVRCPR